MSKQIMTIGNWTTEDVQTMKHTLADGTTDAQFQLFLRTAHASGLNPFLNHIYAITYKGTMSLQIGIEGIAYLAKQHEGYRGYDAQIVCENDTFRAKKSTVFNEKTGEREDQWEIIEHEVGFPRGKIIGAYAIAYRDGFPPFTVLMDWEEVAHFQTSSIPNQQTMWKRYTADMFKKHVAKRALKGQFGIDINEDEIGSGSMGTVEPYERRDITDEVDSTGTASEPEQQKQSQPLNPTQESPADDLAELRKQMNAKFRELGITGKEGKAAFIDDHAKFKDPAKPTAAELKGLIKIMELQIAEKQAAMNDDDDLLI